MNTQLALSVLLLTSSCSSQTPPPRRPREATPPLAVKPLDPPVFVLQQGFAAQQAAMSPDGRLVAECHDNGQISVWSTADAAIVARFDAPTVRCQPIVWGAAGTSFAISDGALFCVWDVTRAERSLCEKIKTDPPPAWSPNQTAVAYWTVDGDVAILDMTTGRSRRERPAGDIAAVGEGGDVIAIAELGRSRLLSTRAPPLEMGEGTIAIAPGDRYVSVESERHIHVWDVAKRSESAPIAGGRAAWSPRGDRLAFIDEHRKVAALDLAKGAPIPSPPSAAESSRAVWITEDVLAFHEETGEIRAFDVKRGTVASLGRSLAEAYWPSPDGSAVLVHVEPFVSDPLPPAFTPGGELRLIDLTSGKVRSRAALDGKEVSIGWSETSSPIAFSFSGKEAEIVDLRSQPATTRMLPGRTDGPRVMPAGPDGEALVSCGKGVVRWNAKLAAPVFFSMPTTDGAAREPFESEDGRAVGATIGGEIVVATAGDGPVRFKVRADHGALDRDGSLVALWWNARNEVAIFDVAKVEKIASITVNGSVTNVAWQPKGGLLLVGGTGTTNAETVIWSAPRRAVVRSVTGGDGQWSPDGARFAVTTQKTVDVIDATTFQALRSIAGRSPYGPEYYFSPDSSKLAVLTFPDQTEYRPRTLSIVDVATGSVLATRRGPPRIDWLGTGEILFGRGNGLTRMTLTTRTSTAIELRRGVQFQHMIGEGRVAAGWDAAAAAVLIRIKDGSQLWLRVAENNGKCGLFVHDEEGRFEGEPLDGIAFRVGSDLRTATLDRTPAGLGAHRVAGLYGRFLRGEPVR